MHWSQILRKIQFLVLNRKPDRCIHIPFKIQIIAGQHMKKLMQHYRHQFLIRSLRRHTGMQGYPFATRIAASPTFFFHVRLHNNNRIRQRQNVVFFAYSSIQFHHQPVHTLFFSHGPVTESLKGDLLQCSFSGISLSGSYLNIKRTEMTHIGVFHSP